MIRPTVGRIVWYRAAPGEFAGINGDVEPLAAIVTRVHSDTVVNLTVFDGDGHPKNRTSVLLLHPDATRPSNRPFCEWMPYQKGQAQKTKELQSQLETGKSEPAAMASAAPQKTDSKK